MFVIKGLMGSLFALFVVALNEPSGRGVASEYLGDERRSKYEVSVNFRWTEDV